MTKDTIYPKRESTHGRHQRVFNLYLKVLRSYEEKSRNQVKRKVLCQEVSNMCDYQPETVRKIVNDMIRVGARYIVKE
jgi:hypothetical protein